MERRRSTGPQCRTKTTYPADFRARMVAAGVLVVAVLMTLTAVGEARRRVPCNRRPINEEIEDATDVFIARMDEAPTAEQSYQAADGWNSRLQVRTVLKGDLPSGATSVFWARGSCVLPSRPGGRYPLYVMVFARRRPNGSLWVPTGAYRDIRANRAGRRLIRRVRRQLRRNRDR